MHIVKTRPSIMYDLWHDQWITKDLTENGYCVDMPAVQGGRSLKLWPETLGLV